MLRNTTDTTSISSLEHKGSSDWGMLPNVLLASIFEYVKDIKDLVNLSQVNKHFKRIGLSKNTKFGFFSERYSYDPRNKELILLPNCINAPHVRAGNQLVKQVIVNIGTGNYKIDTLLNRAMYRHGSYLAMKFILMLSNLGGRVAVDFDMDNLIELYREKTVQALTDEITLAFEDERDRNQYITEMRSALRILHDEVSDNINAFMQSYRYHTSFAEELYKECRRTYDPDTYYAPLVSKQFDAVGFIGYEKPCKEDAWYLQTDAHKKFVKNQQFIDVSFEKYMQTTSSHQHPRMMAR